MGIVFEAKQVISLFPGSSFCVKLNKQKQSEKNVSKCLISINPVHRKEKRREEERRGMERI